MWAALIYSSLWLPASGCNEYSDSHEHEHSHEQGPSHDHDHEATTPSHTGVTAWTGSTEIYIEYPDLVAATEANFAVHVTHLSDFSPVQEARLVLSFEPKAGGAAVSSSQQAPSKPGIFSFAVSLPSPGRWDLAVGLEAEGEREEIRVPDLLVYADVQGAPEKAAGADTNGITFLKEEQWQTPGFRVQAVEIGAVEGSFEASGQIEAAAGRYAEVAAPIAGLVEAAGVRDAPVPGQWVERGRTLLVLTPSLGESGSTFANARRELREARQELARAERLVEVEAIPERRLSEARIRLDAAREALAGLTSGAALAPDGRLAIRAPIAGVVASRELTPGSRVDAGSPLFTLIDPAVVWLRVHVPAAMAPLVSAESGASFQIEGNPRTYHAGHALSVGSIVDPRSRTVPVLYEVDNPDGSIKVGAHSQVRVRTAEERHGVMIPDSAILEEDQRWVAYTQLSGERFERRELRIGARDGQNAVILEGVTLGERVVTGGVYRVRLASHSTALPTHAH